MALAWLLWVLQEPASSVAPPRAPSWEDFPVFVWREKYAGQPLPEELVSPFGGVILMREEDSRWARERGLAYLVWNVAGRDALHLDADEAWKARVEKWIQTHDEKLLVREPCLNDPATREKLHSTLDATLAKHGEHPGLGFVLGDEVGLTPNGDPFDLCRCGFCEAKWQEHARKNGLPGRAPLTDEVRLQLLEDDFSGLGAWLERRRFDGAGFKELVTDLWYRGTGEPRNSAEARGFDRAHHRRTAFGLLGMSGETAFARSTLRGLLDFAELYPVLDSREQFPPFGPPRPGLPDEQSTRFLATLFVADETPDGLAWKAWEHWLRGGSSLVVWNDTELEQHPEHLRRLAEVVRDIRTLQQQGVKPRREHSGIGIVTDPDSVAVSFLRDALLDGPTWPRRTAGYQAERGLRERKVRSWLRLAEDCGELPAAPELATVRADTAAEYRLLVLPELCVLGEQDVSHLEQYLDDGGALIVDGTLGWIDRNGKPWKTSVLDRLRAKGGERVRTAPASLASYLETRLDVERAAAAREFLRSIPDERARWFRETLPAPLELGSDAARLPWLVNRRVNYRRFLYGGEAVAVLPNLVSAEQRQGLREIELQLSAESGVHWFHPSGGRLRAGDAAVFVLREPETGEER